MQEATLHVLDAPIVGLTLETGKHGLSELTIELKAVVPAAALSRLLGSLAALYGIGYAAAGRPDVGFISVGTEYVSPTELLIIKLEIGTPNKIRVCGASVVLDDLYKIMRILTLAVALWSPPSQTGSSDLGPGIVQEQEIKQTVVLVPQMRAPESPTITMLDLQKALNENISMRMRLDEKLTNGEIPLYSYLQQVAALDTACKDLIEALKITTARTATDRAG